MKSLNDPIVFAKWMYAIIGILFMFVIYALYPLYVPSNYDFLNNNLIIEMSIGMLAFVSIFFGFLETDKIEDFIDKTKRLQNRKMIKSIRKQIHRKISAKIGKSERRVMAERKKDVDSLRNMINLHYWFYMSVFCYMSSLIVSLVFSVNPWPNLIFSSFLIFILGVMSTFYLLATMAFFSLIKRNENKTAIS